MNLKSAFQRLRRPLSLLVIVAGLLVAWRAYKSRPKQLPFTIRHRIHGATTGSPCLLSFVVREGDHEPLITGRHEFSGRRYRHAFSLLPGEYSVWFSLSDCGSFADQHLEISIPGETARVTWHPVPSR